MPTSAAKARILLKQGKARVLCTLPFTIQLTYATGETKQPIALGVDPGFDYVGLSACTVKKELYASETKLRYDVSELISDRAARRHTRRCRKTRYRPRRFNNRARLKQKGTLNPSLIHRINSIESCIDAACKLMPVTDIYIELTNFDIEKIRNPEISGSDYQMGPQFGFENTRQFVLHRDRFKCQICGCSFKTRKLEVHHLVSRTLKGDIPSNLVTLCDKCHKKLHEGKSKLRNFNVGFGKVESFRAATFMNIIKTRLPEQVQAAHPDIAVHKTYGYVTIVQRRLHHIIKTHCNDAYCIAGIFPKMRAATYYYQKQVRKHNRQIHKLNFIKGGRRKLQQSPYLTKGFRLYDKVRLPDGRVGFIFGRRATGSFNIRTLDGQTLNPAITCKKLKLLAKRRSFLIEQRPAILDPDTKQS